jgi:hypothetical protein
MAVIGTVTDTAGNPLEGALVQAISIANGLDYYQATTDASGNYAVTGIPPSVNRVEMSVSLAGYVTQSLGHVNTNKDTITQDFQLEQAAASLADRWMGQAVTPAVSLYPVPARDVITILGIKPGPGLFFSLYTVEGKKLMDRQLTNPTLKLTDRSGARIPDGLYYYRLQASTCRLSGKLMIVR